MPDEMLNKFRMSAAHVKTKNITRKLNKNSIFFSAVQGISQPDYKVWIYTNIIFLIADVWDERALKGAFTKVYSRVSSKKYLGNQMQEKRSGI